MLALAGTAFAAYPNTFAPVKGNPANPLGALALQEARPRQLQPSRGRPRDRLAPRRRITITCTLG
jgi:hypothetical protein